MNQRIPKLPHAFFKWYCRPDRYDELHGDLEELFHERAAQSVRKAQWLYCLDVIRCCQPYAWRKTQRQNFGMVLFQNYFKTSSRSLVKNPLSSLINVFGLSVAIGLCVMLYGFWQWVDSMDQFHEHKQEVFLVTSLANREDKPQQYGYSPLPLGQQLLEDFRQLKNVCTVKDKDVLVKYNDNAFYERVRFTDPSFLEMFTFPMKWGTASGLHELNSIILSDKAAKKYFGNENPVGKTLSVVFAENQSKEFEVAGVATKFPTSHAISFDFLLQLENLKLADPNINFSDWTLYADATLLWVSDPTDATRVLNKANKYVALHNEKAGVRPLISFGMVPIAELYRQGAGVEASISSPYYHENMTAVVLLSIITLFLLALACANYVNIAIVTAAKRLKEIGLRKVMGATRRKIVVQFLSENIFITSIALIIGLLLGIFLFIPGFEHINGFNMGFTLAHPRLWIFLTVVLISTGILSGLYPAFYISHFNVVSIFKGATRFGQQNFLSKVLLGFQLVLACIIITSAVMFTQNTFYVRERSWGYDPRECLYVELPHMQAFEHLKNVMSQHSNVVRVAGATHHVGRSAAKKNVTLPPQQHVEVHNLGVDADYFETLQIVFKEGRPFHADTESDQKSTIVNETFVRQANWNNALGQRVEIDNIWHEVVGVVQDFHSYNFDKAIQPSVYTLSRDYRYLIMRTERGTGLATQAMVQAQWKKLFPEIPFQGGLQEDVWGSYFSTIDNHSRFWQVVAGATVLLAALGLYGLVTLNVAGRTKEFSIRKVLGAPLTHIASGIAKQYVWLFGLSLAIGIPCSYALVGILFDVAYVYHAPVSMLSVIMPVVVLLFVLLLVVSTQVRKVENTNPVAGLKVE